MRKGSKKPAELVVESKRISFRVSPEIYDKIKMKMAEAGYNNMSLYLRDRFINERITTIKTNNNDKYVRAQIEQISSKIGKIGRNYNQVVRVINSIEKRMEEKGTFVSESSVIYQMRKVEEQTKKVFGLLDEIREMTNKLDFQNSGETAEY